MTDGSSKFHRDWTLESANCEHQKLLLAFYLHLSIGFTLLYELFYVINRGRGRRRLFGGSPGFITSLLWMECVNDYFNLNYSSHPKIAIWDTWSVVYLENFMFGCTYFYLIPACILTLPKICEIVPLKGLHYWTFIPDLYMRKYPV